MENLSKMNDVNTEAKPTDYAEYGGDIVRWENKNLEYPDCSCGCIWYDRVDDDYGYCRNPRSERFDLLTFEHQSGFNCFEESDA